jgi:hypothetical protein
LDCFHHCHKVGDEFTQGCHVTECMPGGFTKTIENRKYSQIKPAYKGHSHELENVAFVSSCPLYTD